jgi:hypothetical protein
VLSRPEKLSLQAALFSNIGRIEPFWLSADEYYVFETDLVAGLKQQKMLSSALANSGISDFYGIPLCQATNLQYLTYYLSRKINS